ncbi:hypothetical protein BLEM_0884 [Bifidobacterium lemurum]|uniref:DUF559 domain-containing protein n=1 Tax=Bifidobacterium lemurum TaxID=1603886 RepID=A0A261FTB8_9BIFI|nr:hypothetical protein [Bifidobacterium lemurum]OZG62338.1 hypothetical protein BLEM_0884 [Bifidobacterium lemurum]QOL33698.1 hypothetical protein BL8807_07855 [Bifidobacterium lemurum]
MHDKAVGLRRMERRRCNEAAGRTTAPLWVSHINALQYWGASVPETITIRRDVVHVSVPKASQRKKVQGVRFHVFRGAVELRKTDWERFWVFAPPAAWSQMAPFCTAEQLAIIGASLLRRDKRDKVTTIDEITRYVEANPTIRAHATCLKAIPLLVENTDSPKEADLFQLLIGGGMGRPQANWRVDIPGSSRYRLIDLAYPDCKVGFEYQGYHHAEPDQMQADYLRQNQLTLKGWVILYVTANLLETEESRREFLKMAQNIVARQRAIGSWCSA